MPEGTERPARFPMPPLSGFDASDWEILSRFWHPVAYGEEVAADRPFAATLLDVPLVLFRSTGGLVAAPDRCRHRGARLSLGRVLDGCLECPYHGIRYGSAGRCVGLPDSAESDRRARLDLHGFGVRERHGLVWVCLNPEARFDLPDWVELDRPGMHRAHVSDVWEAAASRHVENFTDLAHLAFVHAASFADADHPTVPDYDVERLPDGLSRSIRYQEVDYDDTTGRRLGVVPTVYRYRLTYPFATRLSIEYPSRPTRHFLDVPSPIGPRRSRIFLISASDDPTFDASIYNDFQRMVNAEDKAVVQTQRPEELPLDLRAEAHLGADRFSVEYRRSLAALGLGAVLSA
jgi:phenylpropionate dioxygenase-like ring-hydroxylating dioxygenase large terminal subunit